jgi:hexosaminidase
VVSIESSEGTRVAHSSRFLAWVGDIYTLKMYPTQAKLEWATLSSVALFFLVMSVTAQAQHPTILPTPQQITYGSGTLSLTNLPIRIAPNTTQEDSFAAQTLSACIAQATGQPPQILPSPGEGITLTRTGEVDALPVPGETPGPDSREAYTISVTTTAAEIKARSTAGIYYGVQTLCQMIEQGTLPAAEVKDWPAFAYRGTMVDMSEGPLLRVADIKRQIDLMARWKSNQYYFYNETSIALDGLPPAAPGARLTKLDVREIVAYARLRHVDVVPCLELYGHLHDLFRREEYSNLADFPHGVEFNAADPKVQALIANWVHQYTELFPSPFVHVGFDETWQLQQAAAKGAAAPATFFVQQLKSVSGLFEQQGKTVLAWADIMVKFPAIIPQLPQGILAVPWFYDPRPDPEYRRWLKPLVDAKVPHLVAPGVNGWSEIAPDYNLTFENIDTFVAAGRKSGALGVMNTIWSDDVQMLKRPAWPGIAYGAAASWQQQPIDRATFFAAYAAREYPPASAATVATALHQMAESETALQKVLGQETMLALWSSPFDPKTLAAAEAHAADLAQSRLLAEQAEENWLKAIDQGADAASAQAYLVECRLLDYAGLKFQYGVEIKQQWKLLGAHPTPHQLGNDFDNTVVSQQHGKLPDLMETITELKPQYEQAWLAEYTTYRLAAALGRWDAEYEYWRRLQANLFHVLDNYNPTRGLPPFDSLLPWQ